MEKTESKNKKTEQASGNAKFMLGKKEEMTQLFDSSGRVFPVTVLSAGPVTITQVKNKETDGYTAVQVGYGVRKEKNINKAQKKKGNFQVLREFHVKDVAGYTIGNVIEVGSFSDGDVVEISSTSKGKGFQGGVKRHGFGGGRRSHGQKHSEREPGSIGGGGRAGGRVAKGMRMAGRMGSDRVTLRGVRVIKVDAEAKKIYIKGAVPGRRGSVVEISA